MSDHPTVGRMAVTADAPAPTTKTYADIMRCLREHGPMPGSKLAALLDVPVDWVRRGLNYLKKDLVRHGEFRNRRGGRAEVIWGAKPHPTGAEVQRELVVLRQRLRKHLNSASIAELRSVLDFIAKQRGAA